MNFKSFIEKNKVVIIVVIAVLCVAIAIFATPLRTVIFENNAEVKAAEDIATEEFTDEEIVQIEAPYEMTEENSNG